MSDHEIIRGVMQKACTKCLTMKSLDEFHRHNKTRDGRQSQCKACTCNRSEKSLAAQRERERDRVEREARWRQRLIEKGFKVRA